MGFSTKAAAASENSISVTFFSQFQLFASALGHHLQFLLWLPSATTSSLPFAPSCRIQVSLRSPSALIISEGCYIHNCEQCHQPQGSLFVILPPPGRQLEIRFFHPHQLKIRFFHYHQLKIRFFHYHQLKMTFVVSPTEN